MKYFNKGERYQVYRLCGMYERYISDEQLEFYYSRMVEDGTLSTVFYSYSLFYFGAFREFALERGQTFFAVYEGDEPLGVFWLDGFRGSAAYVHHCFFKNAWGTGRPVRIARDILRRVLNMTKDDGGFVFDVLRGCTPETHRLAIRLLRNIGFVEVGTVPHGAYIAALGRSVPVIESYLTRKEVEAWAETTD